MDEHVTEFNWGSVDVEGSPEYIARERVVRCRDCVHFRPPSKTDRARCDGVFAFVEPTPDGFCAWG